MQDWKHVLKTAITNAVAAAPIQQLLSSVLAAAHTGATEVHPHPISGKAGKILTKSGQMPGPTEKLSSSTKKRARADADGTAALSDEPAGLQNKKKRTSGSKKQAETAAAPKKPTAQPMPAPAAKHVPSHTPPLITSMSLLLLYECAICGTAFGTLIHIHSRARQHSRGPDRFGASVAKCRWWRPRTCQQ